MIQSSRTLPAVLATFLCSVGGVANGASSCASSALQRLATSGVRIDFAQRQPASENAPAHCLIEGTVPTRDNELRFRLGLPEHWNGKFLFEGVGGLVGILVPVDAGLRRGYAVATTDTGHRAKNVSDASWALNAPEKKLDWGHRAVHVATTTSKTLVQRYYDKPIARSYFRGCSNGGRHALSEVQRHPEDYDGVIAGAPALNATTSLLTWTWNTQALAAPGATLSSADWTLLGKAVRAECDARDGLRDGVVESPELCELPRAQLLCSGPKDDNCLSSAQVGAIEKIWNKPRLASGELLLAEGRGYEDDPRVWGWYASAHPAGAAGFLRYMFLDDVGADPLKFDVLRDGPALLQRWAGVYDANNPDMSPFLKRGGKLLLWHGGADAALSPQGTTQYFWRARSVAQQQGIPAAAFDDAVRVYMVPGMAHCAPDVGIDEAELLEVLERWVEKNDRPAALRITLHGMDGSPVVGRPLCPYPEVARPALDTEAVNAGEFHCVNPQSSRKDAGAPSHSR